MLLSQYVCKMSNDISHKLHKLCSRVHIATTNKKNHKLKLFQDSNWGTLQEFNDFYVQTLSVDCKAFYLNNDPRVQSWSLNQFRRTPEKRTP